MAAHVIADVVNQPADYWGYVAVGYGATILALGGYAIRTLRRGRKLSRQVPPDRRRWL